MLSGAPEEATGEDERPDPLADKLRDIQEVNEKLEQSGFLKQFSDMTGEEAEPKKKRWWRSK
jgi:hypothetical protein